jgi:hypothetical protein
MESRLQRQRFTAGKHLFSGVVFVAIGLLFLLGNMGVLEVRPILRFWPVLLIAVGAFKLAESGENYAHSSGVFWIVIGGLFLLGTLNVIDVSFRDFWPVLLIGFGVLMLWRSTLIGRERDRAWGGRPPDRAEESTRSESTSEPQEPGPSNATSNSVISAMAILGGVERKNNSQDFRGGTLTAVMGGCEIDLRGADITVGREPVLEVFALWGGIEVKVPAHWTVVSHVDPILGGYEDGTRPPKEETKRLIIRGTAIMGGVEVSN